MTLGIRDDLLVKFAICYKDVSFSEGYTAAPKIGVQHEADLVKEMELVKRMTDSYQNGYYIGICFKNRASRLHKLGMRKLKELKEEQT